ncbi:flagellar basal body P-ring protein FlgI [Thauera butanivorans]|uniref:flagellar basal body P-ring protein FlgI n=1 Tax=Thauera butanivorans TaxID=86174 RepID=UPI000838FB86|nr:flagellar basal body P-ring protein FlgI [Thauera butanivorans]
MNAFRSLLTRALVVAVAAGIFFVSAAEAAPERIKDLATIAGVRENQLVGYGLVVGLDGSGDQTTQTPFTKQSIVNMLGNMGVTVPQGTNMQLKNVAAVMVTASLPAFARPGQAIDVTVSSIGNAKSLRGGTLVMTPLKGADGQVYAVAQGNLAVGGAGGAAGGAAQTINHLAAGRIPGGATVERGVAASVGQGDFVMVELNEADFHTAGKVVDAINAIAPGSAYALDGRSIQVMAPQDVSRRVAFLGRIENLRVAPGEQIAKVIVNSRTGSVVMNQRVTLQNVAVSHGNLTVTVDSQTEVSQPAPFSRGETVAAQNQGQVDIRQDGGSIHNVRAGGNLADVVKALNALGAKPMDLVSILQAMKAAGALRAELEII